MLGGRWWESAVFSGKNLAVFRGEDGRAHALDAYCCHNGANLAVGGLVKGSCLECPFHGWQFRGDDGKCTHIPYCDRSASRSSFSPRRKSPSVGPQFFPRFSRFARKFAILAVPRKLPRFYASCRNFLPRRAIFRKFGWKWVTFIIIFRQLTSKENAILCRTGVFQALNSPSTHRTKHRVLIWCQNIAVSTTSLYRTVLTKQKSLNTFFCKLFSRISCAFVSQFFRDFAVLCRNFSRKIGTIFPFFVAIFCQD